MKIKPQITDLFLMALMLVVSANAISKNTYISPSGLVKFIIDYDELSVKKGHVGSNLIKCKSENLILCFYSSEFDLMIAFPKFVKKNQKIQYKGVDITVTNIFKSKTYHRNQLLFAIETMMDVEILNVNCKQTDEYIFNEKHEIIMMTIGYISCNKEVFYEGEKLDFFPATYLLLPSA